METDAPRDRMQPNGHTKEREDTMSNVLLVSMESRVTGKGGQHVRIGDQTYAAPALPSDVGGGFQLCVLDRNTLKLELNQSFATGAADPSTLMTALEDLVSILDVWSSRDVIVVLSSLGTPLSDLIWGERPLQQKLLLLSVMLGIFGAGNKMLFELPGKKATYSLVGYSGAHFGNGFELSSLSHGGAFESNISGTLQRGIEGRYAFVYPTYVPFQTANEGSVKVGDQLSILPVVGPEHCLEGSSEQIKKHTFDLVLIILVQQISFVDRFIHNIYETIHSRIPCHQREMFPVYDQALKKIGCRVVGIGSVQ